MGMTCLELRKHLSTILKSTERVYNCDFVRTSLVLAIPITINANVLCFCEVQVHVHCTCIQSCIHAHVHCTCMCIVVYMYMYSVHVYVQCTCIECRKTFCFVNYKTIIVRCIVRIHSVVAAFIIMNNCKHVVELLTTTVTQAFLLFSGCYFCEKE